MEKQCKDCKEVKSVFAFALSNNSDDMCFPICKVCVGIRYQAQLKRYNHYFKGTSCPTCYTSSEPAVSEQQ